jgi:hypothetical protein
MSGNKKLAWFTALRLDSLSTTELLQLCNKVQEAEASAILLTGNVSASGKAAEDLLMLELYTDIPIYYVMGTTDYEKKSVEKTRADTTALSTDKICWLQSRKLIELNDSTALVGVDSWGDVALGAGDATEYILATHRQIDDLRHLETKEMLKRLRNLAEQDVKLARELLTNAFKKYEKVIFATGIPPFVENTLKDGAKPNDHMLPFCVCKSMGDMLLEIMKQHSKKQLVVTAGLVHTGIEYKPLDNLCVKTGNQNNTDIEPLNIIEVN